MDLFLDFVTIFRKLMVLLAMNEKVQYSSVKGSPCSTEFPVLI